MSSFLTLIDWLILGMCSNPHNFRGQRSGVWTEVIKTHNHSSFLTKTTLNNSTAVPHPGAFRGKYWPLSLIYCGCGYRKENMFLKSLKINFGGWRMSQQFRALTSLANDLSSNPSTHMEAHNHARMKFKRLWCPLWSLWHCTHVVHKHTCGQSTHEHKILKLKMFIKLYGFLDYYIICPLPFIPSKPSHVQNPQLLSSNLFSELYMESRALSEHFTEFYL